MSYNTQHTVILHTIADQLSLLCLFTFLMYFRHRFFYFKKVSAETSAFVRKCHLVANVTRLYQRIKHVTSFLGKVKAPIKTC